MNYDPDTFPALLAATGHAPGANRKAKSKSNPKRGRPSVPYTHEQKLAANAATVRRRRDADAEFCQEHFGVSDPATVIRLMRLGKIEIPRRLDAQREA